MIGPPLNAKALAEHIRNMTSEEVDATIAEMVADGILDEDGNVLLSARVPEPPDWVTGKYGHARSEVPADSKKKTKKPRKHS